jgi:hypothetical protein
VAITLVFGGLWLGCVVGSRAIERRPHWDSPTDLGALWAFRTGIVACPIVAVVGPFLT